VDCKVGPNGGHRKQVPILGQSGFVGCLAFIGENNTRVKELWAWEEAVQGSHETSLRNNATILHHLEITTISRT
jgi:hypothetical protein